MKNYNEKVAISKKQLSLTRFEQMNLRSQKLFFLPLTQVYWQGKKSEFLRTEISIPKEYVTQVLGIAPNSQHENSELIRYYQQMIAEAYAEEKNAPYLVRHKAGHKYIFFDIINPDSVFKFDMKIETPDYVTIMPEIAERLTCEHTLRLWKGIIMNQYRDCYTTDELKTMFGLSKYEYCGISKADQQFLEWYDNAEAHSYDDVMRHNEIMEKIHFDRWRFDNKILYPAFDELKQLKLFEFNRGDIEKVKENRVITGYKFPLK